MSMYMLWIDVWRCSYDLYIYSQRNSIHYRVGIFKIIMEVLKTHTVELQK